ncbi:MAG TPA: TIGR02300 family protein [Vitreimonas sp.]|nr:TIGR02300 family protein [Vitreimonas sp.]
MARTDLGDKQVCPNCGAKFYDLRKRPAVCPKCTTAFDPSEDSVRTRRTRSRVSANDPIYQDDEEEVDAKKKATDDDDDEEEAVEDAVEVDAEAAAEPLLSDDEDEDADTKASGDDLPEGFSEEEADLGDDAGEDDGVPMLEDEEEFNEDEIGELPGDGDDDNER